MRDNFELIKTLIDFEEANTFYFLQILKRKKDNPGQREDSITIKILYIYSMEDLDRYRERIIRYCTENNARAYIGINRLDLEMIALHVAHETTGLILKKQYKAVRNVYESACGSFSDEKTKKWIVDIDGDILDRKELIIDTIRQLHKEIVKSKHRIIAEVPTKTGIHLITNPFNLEKFGKIKTLLAKGEFDPLHELEVKKNHPTVLYVP